MRKSTFNSGEPLAYFLTWTTYGTWLPGDERGWNQKRGQEQVGPDRLASKSAQAKLKDEALYLTANQKEIVEQTIRAHCDIRTWTLHAINVRSNHVHVVVTAKGYSPRIVRDQFKAWCTRKLKEVEPGRTLYWSEGASCRWINQEDDLESAVLYVLEAQDRFVEE